MSMTVLSGFLLGIVSCFWLCLRDKPQFHVLFMAYKKNREQINAKHYLRHFKLVLIPVVSITAGFSSFISVNYFGIRLGLHPYYFNYLFTLNINEFYQSALMLSLIAGIGVSAPLYIVYRNKPEWLQPSLRRLLLISIFLLGFTTGEMIHRNLFEWYRSVSIGNNSTNTTGIMSFNPSSTLLQAFFSYAPVTLFLVSFIVLFYLAHRITAEYGKFYTLEPEEHLQGFIEEGVAILPKKVRIGDSYSVPLDLTLSECFKSGFYHHTNGRHHYKRRSSDYLEAELQAVGLKVDGEKRVQIYETSQIPLTTWNCRFVESGTHTINIMIHLVKSYNNSRNLIFSKTHDVKVSSLLAASLLPALTLVVPIVVVVVQALLK